MRFLRTLEATAALVEHRLAEVLPLAEPPDRLTEAMRYACLGGGKRLRPLLAIEAAALFGLVPAQAIDAAVAIECLHCYSLAHDDLPAMDDDDLRRGRPSLHNAFDEATAILAGDALLTFAFELMARPSTHEDAEVRCRLIAGLAQAAGWTGMAGGQALDLLSEHRSLELSDIRRLNALKTGALITFSCETGALLAKAGDSGRAALKRFGVAVGRAFQIADDLLDVEGDAVKLGKVARKDRSHGKATLVASLGVEAARAELAQLVLEAREALAPFGAKGEILAEAARFIAERER